MSIEEKREQVYQRACKELAEYRKWLLTKSPEEILQLCDNYIKKNSIVATLSYIPLTEQQLDALIACPSTFTLIDELATEVDILTQDAYQEYAEKAILEKVNRIIEHIEHRKHF